MRRELLADVTLRMSRNRAILVTFFSCFEVCLGVDGECLEIDMPVLTLQTHAAGKLIDPTGSSQEHVDGDDAWAVSLKTKRENLSGD